MTGTKKGARRNVAALVGLNIEGVQVFAIEVSLSRYYDGHLDVIDSKGFRSASGIVRLSGELFDSRGVLVEEFENRYGTEGQYIGGRARFEDGTVQED